MWALECSYRQYGILRSTTLSPSLSPPASPVILGALDASSNGQSSAV